MAFLYGDSSPSPLEIDYIDYLRRALALAVEILLVEEQLAEATRRRRAAEARSAELGARLERLRAAARQAVGDVARAPVDDPVTHCANHIESAVDDVVARAVAEVQALADKSAAEVAARERTAHAAGLAAVEGFLRRHDFPDASVEIDIQAEGSGYTGLLRASTPYQVVGEIELDLRDSPFAAGEVRAGSLARDAELHVPESAGWRRKETRLAAVKTDRLVVVGVRRDPAQTEVRLRASRDPGAEGFDASVARDGGHARLTRIGRDGASEELEHSADNDRALGALTAALAGVVDGLATRRTTLRGITIDDTPLDEHDRPSVLVDRMFAAMAPQVRTIAQRSLNPGELVIRKQLGDGRREEIFVAHSALAEVVAQVPVARRRHFDVLGIPGVGGGRAPTGEVDVDMVVEEAALSDPSISVEHEPEPVEHGPEPAAGDQPPPPPPPK